MLNDPLANALNMMMNAQKAGKSFCTVKPISKMMMKVLDIMHDHKYIGKVEVVDERQGKMIRVELLGKINNCAVVKPRYSVKKGTYEKFEERYLPAKNFGFLIVSTSKEIMTHLEAKEKGLGGMLLAYVY